LNDKDEKMEVNLNFKSLKNSLKIFEYFREEDEVRRMVKYSVHD
jgi:hypothetical protein